MNTNQKILIGGGLGVAALLLFSRSANASTLTQGKTEWISVETPNQTGTTADPYGKQPIGQKPRGIRNNNPLNIVKSNIPWNGKTGNDGVFETFDSAENGIRAAARNLKTYRDKYGLRSVRGIISRWTAEESAQSQQNYINFVTNKMGVSESDTLITVEQYAQLVTSMIQFENGQQPYDYSMIQRAVANGLA
jgi:hypothetical protein